MAEREGWEVPELYTDTGKEVEGVHAAAGLCDISPVGKLVIEGPRLGSFISRAFSGATLAIGHAQRQVLLGWAGTLVDYVLLCRPAEDRLLAMTAASKAGTVAEVLERYLPDGAGLRDATQELAAIAVMGPSSADVLAGLGGTDLYAIPDMSTIEVAATGTPVTLLRADIRGQQCFQFYVGSARAELLWDAILDAGRDHGVAPVGWLAWRRLGG